MSDTARGNFTLTSISLTDRAALAKKLREARESAGFTQEEAAQRLGVHAMTISRWERGEQGLRAAALSKAASVYGVRLADLISGNDDDVSESVSRGTRSIDIKAKLEMGNSAYSPRLAGVHHVPAAALDLALSYIARLDRAGVPHDEIERFERQLVDDRMAMQFSRRHGIEWNADDWILHMESVWQHAQDWLIPRGTIP